MLLKCIILEKILNGDDKDSQQQQKQQRRRIDELRLFFFQLNFTLFFIFFLYTFPTGLSLSIHKESVPKASGPTGGERSSNGRSLFRGSDDIGALRGRVFDARVDVQRRRYEREHSETMMIDYVYNLIYTCFCLFFF